ncbi:diguanylate cyclase, missing stop codon [Bifidobacterium stellenboschense]|uniref:Diguanylate cyclase, missing stop codon n=1 Tax=Bifidobacterium stellenboschense TaxID=762211 RepID=A0A087DPX0_9BIFI|nr:diguanylate cyclase, missing stop codon [Bifidobacterium stellenboschense]
MSLIEMMILGFLSEKTMCGYELRKKMEQLQGDMRRFSDGAIYPATGRLAKAGLISEQTDVRDGRQRHLFTLEPAGREALVEALKTADGFILTDFNRWRVVLTFLSVVPDKADRDAVLRRRYDLLSGGDVHFFYCDAGSGPASTVLRPAASMNAATDFLAASSSEASWTTVGAPSLTPVARVAAKVVLKPLTTLDWGSLPASHSAADFAPSGSARSKVVKSIGLDTSTMVLPANWPA